MITAQQANAHFLAMPVVEQGIYRSRPDFRVKDKIFAVLLPGQFFADLRVGKEEQVMLATQNKRFRVPEGPHANEWIGVRLDAVDSEEFEALVWKAWRYTAPPRLASQY